MNTIYCDTLFVTVHPFCHGTQGGLNHTQGFVSLTKGPCTPQVLRPRTREGTGRTDRTHSIRVPPTDQYSSRGIATSQKMGVVHTGHPRLTIQMCAGCGVCAHACAFAHGWVGWLGEYQCFFIFVHDYNPSSRTEYCIRIELDRMRECVCV